MAESSRNPCLAASITSTVASRDGRSSFRASQAILVAIDALPQARDTAQKRVRHFAARWNLDRVPAVCEIEYHLLHYALDRTGTVVGGTRLGPFGPGPIPLGMYIAPELPAIVDDGRRWDWRPTSGESLGAFRSRIATCAGPKPHPLGHE